MQNNFIHRYIHIIDLSNECDFGMGILSYRRVPMQFYTSTFFNFLMYILRCIHFNRLSGSHCVQSTKIYSIEYISRMLCSFVTPTTFDPKWLFSYHFSSISSINIHRVKFSLHKGKTYSIIIIIISLLHWCLSLSKTTCVRYIAQCSFRHSFRNEEIS